MTGVESSALQTKGVRYDVPALRKHQEHSYELEALLLAWSLLLYRHSHGNHVEFSWGLGETGSETCRTFTLNTSKLQWDSSDSVASELEVFRSYLQQQLESEKPVTTDGYRFFFNDEAASGDVVNQVTEDGNLSVNWVSALCSAAVCVD